MNEIDTDGSDMIEFKEFCIFIIFKFFDVDNDGYVNLSDIKITVDNLGLCEPDAVGYHQGSMASMGRRSGERAS